MKNCVGTITSISDDWHGSEYVSVNVRHGKPPKKGKDGMIAGPSGPESRVVVTRAEAAKLKHGARVHISMEPVKKSAPAAKKAGNPRIRGAMGAKY